MDIITSGNNAVQALHDYIGSRKNIPQNIALSIFNDIQSNGPLYKSIHLSNDTLYSYCEHPLYRVFSIGGRVIYISAKPALSMTQARRRTIKARFLSLDNKDEGHLIEHFNKLIDLSSSRQYSDYGRQLSSGTFKVHMMDMMTPYVEIGESNEGPIVMPLNFMIKAAGWNMLPSAIIKYAGQHILLFNTDDYTVRLLYVGHLLEDSLFT